MRLKSKQPLGFAQRPQRRPFSRNQVSWRNGLRRTLDFIRLTLHHSSALRHVASVPTTPAGCCLLVLVATVPQPLPLLPSCSLTLWTKAAPQRYLPLRPLAFGLWPAYFSPSMRRLPKALSGPPPVLSSPPLILVSFPSALGPLTDAAATYLRRMSKCVPLPGLFLGPRTDCPTALFVHRRGPRDELSFFFP